jgi:Uma2 family endonuclease
MDDPTAHAGMVAALKLPPHAMTVAEFLEWNPDDGSGGLWQLRDGEPEMMAPASDVHGSIQSELGALLRNHLLERGGPCRVVTAPGVVPPVRSDYNMLVPDLAVTCKPPARHAIAEPLVLIEILSPSNTAKTRANIAAYRTVPSVQEIVVLNGSRVFAEVLRRTPDGAWPAEAEYVAADSELRLESIDFAIPLRAAYRTAGLA